MLRNLNQERATGRICGTPHSGVLAAAIPTDGDYPALGLNDIDAGDPAGCEYAVEILSLSAGTMDVAENTAFTYTPPSADYVGTVTGTQRVRKNGVAVYDETFSFTYAAAGAASVSSSLAASYGVRALVSASIAASYILNSDVVAPARVINGGGAGDLRSVREYADRLDKADKPPRPTKAAKKRRRKQLEVVALELLPDEPAAIEAAQIIAQVVAKQEVQAIERWTPPSALMPVIMPPPSFDATEAIRVMVEQWQQNEAIRRELEDEVDVELLLMG